jgi:integrase
VGILEAMAGLGNEPDALAFFPGSKPGRMMSDMTLAAVRKRMGRDNITAHGFRSSFSTWCAETTDTPHEVREVALAHANGDKVAAAYQRGDMFAKRRALMEAWAMCCTGGAPDAG